MAVKRYVRDYLFSICSVFSLVAFLVPLLTLLGIRDGIIGTLTKRLLENPRNLELASKGVGTFPLSFFRELRTHPATGFIVPETRTLSASLSLIKEGLDPVRVDLAATGQGDPLIAASEPPPPINVGPAKFSAYLSRTVADKLKVVPGEELIGQVGRLTGGREETVQLKLTLAGILPLEVAGGYFLFCPLEVLTMVEDYRSGFAIEELNWPGRVKPELPKVYPRFRLYAKNLDGVEEIKAYLAAKDIEVVSRAEEIALVRRLNHSFTVIFLALLVVVGGGAFASAASGAVDQVAKIRRSLAVLALLGLSRAHLTLFTVFQSLLTGCLAVLAAEGLFLGLSHLLNVYFGGNFGLGESVCYLAPEKLALAGLLVSLFMLAASSAAVISLLDLEPSEGMRDV
ncbi:MAG: ABC transporter permease [Deltaproteobacteria bacterium]|nr:ABC transporter permease [Deltaproteobacteria bacterium]